MSEAAASSHQATDRTARRSLWPWFIAGFLIVFVGMSVAVTMYSMLPSGRGVVGFPLWQYYIFEVRRALTSPRGFGLASGGGAVALTTAFQHLLCSTVGGAATAGVAWAVRRSRTRRQNAA